MAAYADLVSLLNSIHTIKNHPTLSTSLDNKHIQPLCENIDFLLKFMEGKNYVGVSKEAQDLERKITSVAHAAEDLIESHIVDQIHRASRIWPIFRAFLPRFVVYGSQSKTSLGLQRIKEDMDAIIKEVNEVEEKRRLEVEQQPTHLERHLRDDEEASVVGLDAELNQLLEELNSNISKRCVISIVGMGGTGKTTLAKKVYKTSLVRELFQLRAWAAISPKNNAEEVLSILLSSLGERSKTTHDLGQQIHQALYGKRYLIVLDDIWDVQAWYDVKNFFPDHKNGSRVILTTRLPNVAIGCGSSSLIKMGLLDKDNSRRLFHEKAFQNQVCPTKLQDVCEEIVELCKGLSLSIVVIGSLLLKSPRTFGYWNSVATDLKSIPNSKEKQPSLQVLSLSYKHLPPHLKPCFLYMGMFKEGSEILTSKIIRLWVAEGFIKPIESRALEEIAEDNIRDLTDRNLISACRWHKNGKVKSCVIHDLLRDLCIKIAEEEGFFHETRRGIQGTERRLVPNGHLKWTGSRLPLARSIIRVTSIEQLFEYRLLRVLDAYGNHSDVDCYENVNLRFFAKQCQYDLTGVWKLPTSVSLMWNLQTLTITLGHEFLLVVAPTEFWEMRQLRHVECRRIYLPSPPRTREDELLRLDNLLTLKATVNFRLCEEVCKIIPNIKKLQLDYDSKLQGYDGSDCLIESVSNLRRFQNLESFNMTTDISTRPDCRDRELNKKLPTSFPNMVKKLSLSKCELCWEDLATIGLLPHLEVLKLGFHSVNNGEQWSPVDDQFRNLKLLKIEACHLVSWNAESSHFPALETLHLENLRSLEEIPLGLGDITTLQLIRVHCCSESAAVSAVKIKEYLLDCGCQTQVQVNLLEASLPIFREMLEAGELTIDNIDLEIL